MKFVIDGTVGKLGKRLRLMGYDVADMSGMSGDTVLKKRILLTRKTHLSTDIDIKDVRVFQVISNSPTEQLREVVTGLRLEPDEGLFFTRCMFCNTQLTRVPAEDVRDRVPDYVWQQHDRFFLCAECGRVYWRGTHYDNMKRMLTACISRNREG